MTFVSSGFFFERPLGPVVFVHYLTTFSEGSCGVYRGFSVKNNGDWGHKRKGNVEGIVHPQAGVGQSVWNGGWTLNRRARVPLNGGGRAWSAGVRICYEVSVRPVGGCPASQVVGRPEIRVRPNARMGMGGRVLLTVRRPECLVRHVPGGLRFGEQIDQPLRDRLAERVAVYPSEARILQQT